MPSPIEAAFACCFVWISPTMAAVVLWDESISGDLADDYTTPTRLNAALGDNRVVGSLRGSDLDLDLFTLTVSAGHELSAIRLINYTTGSAANLGFIGMQPGSNLSSPPSNFFPDPVGYVLYGNWAVGQNVLPTIAGGKPFNGVNSLPAGQYAIWMNETGASGIYQWSFEITPIPEPGSVTLLLGGLLTPFFLRTRARS